MGDEIPLGSDMAAWLLGCVKVVGCPILGRSISAILDWPWPVPVQDQDPRFAPVQLLQYVLDVHAVLLCDSVGQ